MQKSTKTILTIILLLVILAGLIFIAIRTGIFAPQTTTNKIRMEVISSGGYAIITYSAGDKGTKEAETVTTPWRKTFNVEEGDSVFLTAGNPSQSGKISCIIELNGKVWKTDQVEFPQQAVACAGIIPRK